MSAVSASPAASGSRVVRDPVRALQHALYRAAKADPGRRFHALYDKVCLRCPKLSGQGSIRILIRKGTGSSAKRKNLHS